MSLKTVKGIDEAAWAKFKALAAQRRVPMGKMFASLVQHYEQQERGVWDELFAMKPILSKREADALLRETKKVRHEYGFR